MRVQVRRDLSPRKTAAGAGPRDLSLANELMRVQVRGTCPRNICLCYAVRLRKKCEMRRLEEK